MPVEGWKPEQIQRYAGRIENFLDPVIPRDAAGNILKRDEFGKLYDYTREFTAGQYTDDTILTIALAESLLHHGLDLEHAAAQHILAYHSNIKGGFGRTTVAAFKRLEQGISPIHSGVTGQPGNGPAMKMAPVGLYMHATGDTLRGLQFSEQVSKMTHLDPRSVVSGMVQAAAIFFLGEKYCRQDFIDALYETSSTYEQPVPSGYYLAEQGTFTERLRWILEHNDASTEEAYHTLGNSGLVYQSHPFAIFMFQHYWNNPMEGLLATVNYGGDCDTTGAMYGALAGAKHGMFFPSSLVERLQEHAYLMDLGWRLSTMNRGP